ncbi:MAG: 3-hydroxyacyl-CoA dehydrogenase NAD-binding domain-containing protein, partial [Alphaproteobacteria bacterium]|nr:3-hydroxyacyl-CoA dehydrogenase NAD-binding domain-containing protein [Alphaproteobacteria bacterium]
MTEIKKAAVFGAGVMGAGIAAQVANAGVPVVLLDIAAEDGGNRSAIAEGAVEKLLKTDPAPLMHKLGARLITTGNIDDDMGLIADCDWIVEAIIERVDLKQGLYKKIQAARKPGSIVSSNTSTIPLARLTEGMAEDFQSDFLITHFFNPPRYLRLLELVAGERTRAHAVETVTRFADFRLGKTIVPCKDTPGFIANRIGIYWLQCGVVRAMDEGLTIEEADAVMGRPAGIPKTGVFGLLDMVGLDLMPHVLCGMAEALPEQDPFHEVFREPELIKRMIGDGYTGRKGKGGFYRLKPDAGKKIKEAIDLGTGEYHTAQKPILKSVAKARKSGLKAMLEHGDKTANYAWWVLSRTLSYAARLVPEIADDIVAVDDAMRLGYNWKYGPFELIDQLGTGWFAEGLRRDGLPVPPLLEVAGRSFYRTKEGRLQFLGTDGEYRDVVRPEGVLLLADIKRRARPVVKNRSASLWDIGDGVACLEIHTKLNAIDPEVLAIVEKAVKIVEAGHKALVIYNEGSNFSAGANVGLALFAANTALWPMIEGLVEQGQKAYRKLKHAPFPVVSAPSGMALGGGCEILLHSDAIQAHSESYIGLVETGVGLIPGWGGCTELLSRLAADPKRPNGPMPPVVEAFETIGMAKVARSAFEARELGFLRPEDGITFNRERLLAEAKAKALELVEGDEAPEPVALTLPGAALRFA